jgi:hypothetical protein
MCSQTPSFKLEKISKKHPNCPAERSIHHLSIYKLYGEITITERTYNHEAHCVQPLDKKYMLDSSPDNLKALETKTNRPGPTYLLLRNNTYANGLWCVFNAKK